MKTAKVKKVDVVVLDSPMDVLGFITRRLPENAKFTIFETKPILSRTIIPFLDTRGDITYSGESIPKCVEKGDIIITMELNKLSSRIQENINKIIYI